MAFLHNYSPDLIIVTWGSIFIGGYVDGTFVTVERDEDSYTKKVGATADVVRVRNLNKGGNVKCTIDQGSITNDQLTAAWLLDQGFNTFQTQPLVVKDLNGTTLVHGEKAWIKKPSNAEFGKDASNRDWVFDVAAFDTYVVGGALV